MSPIIARPQSATRAAEVITDPAALFVELELAWMRLACRAAASCATPDSATRTPELAAARA